MIVLFLERVTQFHFFVTLIVRILALIALKHIADGQAGALVKLIRSIWLIMIDNSLRALLQSCLFHLNILDR